MLETRVDRMNMEKWWEWCRETLVFRSKNSIPRGWCVLQPIICSHLREKR